MKYRDPTGLDYRTDFIDATPGVPANYQIHHTYQQRIAERLLAEANIDVHATQYLRAIDPDLHSEITSIQNKFWREKAVKYGSLEKAYEKTPLKEIRELNSDIESAYSHLWIKCGSSKSTIAKVKKEADAVLKAKDFALKKGGRMSGVLKKSGIALSAILIVFKVAEQAATASELANPSRETQAAFNDFLSQYRIMLDHTVNHDTPLNANQLERLGDSFERWLQAINADDNLRNIIRVEFNRLRAEAGE